MILAKWVKHGAFIDKGQSMPRVPGDEDLMPAKLFQSMKTAGLVVEADSQEIPKLSGGKYIPKQESGMYDPECKINREERNEPFNLSEC